MSYEEFVDLFFVFYKPKELVKRGQPVVLLDADGNVLSSGKKGIWPHIGALKTHLVLYAYSHFGRKFTEDEVKLFVGRMLEEGKIKIEEYK